MLRRVVPLAAVAAVALAPAVSHAGPFSHLFSKPTQADKAASSGKVDAVIEQVQQALDERRYVDAADQLEKARIDGIKSPRLTTLEGELMLAHGRFADALSQFKLVEGEPSEKARAFEGEGLALSLMGKSDAALADLKVATATDKTLWRAWNGLGREYDMRHEWKESKAAYAEALTAPGASTGIVLNNRGYSYLLQNEPELAIPDLVAALAKDPDLAAARTNLRIAMAIEGHYDRASTTGAGDDRAAVLNNVGLAAAIRGDYQEAEKLLGEAIEAKGNNYARASDNLQLAKNLEAHAAEQSHTPNATP